MLAGALPALTFPEPSRWWFAYVCLVPLLLLCRSAPSARDALLRGWCGGAGFILAVHHWLLPNLLVFLPLVAVVVGALWAPLGWASWLLLRPPANGRRVATALAVLPSGWLLIELVRSSEYLGGPWGLIGASQWQVPGVRSLAALGGVWLVSAVVVMVNVAVAVLVAVLPAGSGGRRTGLAAAVTALWLVAVAALAWSAAAPTPSPVATAQVALVQPGVVRGAATRFARGEALTRELRGRALDLVVWGESSVGADLDDRPDLRRRLVALAREVSAPLLVNVDARATGRPGIFKSAVLVTPSGITAQRYDKLRLVPFGEYVPLRGLLGWIAGPTEAAAEDRRRGRGPVLIDVGGEQGSARLQVGPLVCFESSFPDMSRDLAERGADMIVVQSSTSTFQQSWSPEQHASLAAIRAAETATPVVHATLTGHSVVYDATGRPVGAPIPTGETTAAVYALPIVDGSTPYLRFGDWVPALAAVVTAVALTYHLRARQAGTVRRPGRRPGRRGRHMPARPSAG
ncbi:MAG: apolipoprotein N-acyltransferase [Nocardioidaceae bacterium]